MLCYANTSSRLLLMPRHCNASSFINHAPVCRSVFHIFHMISQKPMQLRSPNLTYKCSTMSHRNPFMFGAKDTRSRVTKTLPACGSLHSCECWLLLVLTVIFSDIFSRQEISCCMQKVFRTFVALRRMGFDMTPPTGR